MRHLIAKRDRARDMLTELENDNWAYFSDAQLREVISDDNFALMLAEMQQLKDMRELRMEKDGWTDIKSDFPAVVSFNDMLMEQRQHVVQHQGRLAYWDGQRAHAEKMISIHARYIRDCTLHVANRWAKLSDQERAFFGRPPANETSIFNFPTYQGVERGYFYPEPTTWHICVQDKLRVTLAALEKEIEEKGGENE